MPSGRTGETVLGVKAKKDRLIVLFSNGKELEMSPDTYSGFFLYKGKELSTKEFQKLQKAAKEERLKAYAISYCAKGSRSKKQLADALVKRGSDHKAAYALAYEMEREGLIEEEALAEELFERYSGQGRGRAYIERKLKEKGLPIPDKEIDLEAMEMAFERLLTQYSKYPLLKRKVKIGEALYRRGYSRDQYEHLVDGITNTAAQDKAERESLKIELAKLIKGGKGYNPKADKQKIYAKLLAKGYRQGDIHRAMEEMI